MKILIRVQDETADGDGLHFFPTKAEYIVWKDDLISSTPGTEEDIEELDIEEFLESTEYSTDSRDKGIRKAIREGKTAHKW